MNGLIASWRAIARMGRSHAPEPQRCETSARDEREVARQLAETIERAMGLGLWEHADRVAGSAARIAKDHPHLTERLARLRLAQNDPRTAVAIIDACATHPASLRLLRATCLLQLGRRIEVHMELRSWAGKSSAPLQARLMLALLEWHSGDSESATAALQRNLRQLEDPRTLAALMFIATAENRAALAASWAERLRTACAWSAQAPMFDVMLRSLGFQGAARLDVPIHQIHVLTLANELLANEPVIPALVEVQRRQFRRETANLLLGALETALPDLEDQAAGFEALARLSLVCGTVESAVRWASTGAEQFPLSANLARLTRELFNQRVDGRSEPKALRRINTRTDDIAGQPVQERAA